MKAVVWLGPHQMEVQQMPEPEATAGWVVIRPLATGVCGSEIEGYLGRMANRIPPLVMGHEFAGEVVTLGAGVDPSWLGRRAVVNPLLGCGECERCASGEPNLCPTWQIIGVHRPGGFAEYVAVPAASLVALPAGLDARLGALVEPMANAVHAAGMGLAAGPARRTAVIGAGTIGLLCAQAVRLDSGGEVVAVEPHPARRARALELGATAAVADGAEAGQGFDLVIDAVGAEATRRLACRLSRPGGTVVLVGLHDSESSLELNALIRRQLTLRGSFAYTPADFGQALDWLAAGWTGLGPLAEPLPLEAAADIFARLGRGPVDEAKVFLAAQPG